QVSVLAGTGAGGFGAALDLAVGAGAASVITGDLDGDGRLDVVVGNATSGDVSILHNDAAGGFGASRISAGGPVSQLTLADLDGDGHADLAVASGQAFVTLLRSPR
ncbi:MAG TPA: VCBS repeat-containing protein, partial [Kofleriaceae bacterium]